MSADINSVRCALPELGVVIKVTAAGAALGVVAIVAMIVVINKLRIW